jgi:hypothetical protein
MSSSNSPNRNLERESGCAIGLDAIFVGHSIRRFRKTPD